MASLAGIYVPMYAVPTMLSALTAGTASAVQTFGKYAILAIEATNTINVTFCNAANPPTVTTNNGWQIPSGAVHEFELGAQWDSVIIWNPNVGTVDVYIIELARS